MFIRPDRYDGRNTVDSMRLSLDQFGMLYGQFRNATIKGRELLPSPSVFLSKKPGLYQKSDTINLALLAMEYDYIRATALENKLITWLNGQLVDVAGRRASPYLQDTSFAFVALNQNVQGLTFHFVLTEELMLSNLDWKIQQVEIDFGNGKGFQKLKPNEIKSVSYDRSGTKTIRLRYVQNGQMIHMASFVKVEELPISGDTRENVPYDDKTPEKISLTGMDLSIFSACADGKVRRPLIVLEGFGGEEFDISDMFKLLDFGMTSDGIALREYLNTNEYDLIYIDYHNSFAAIESNANNLIEAIEWINARKHADGSNETNVLIGNSMGGLVGKVAILKMHNELALDSEIERFFTYDAPLKGANFPIGIQAFIRDLLDQAGEIGASTASLTEALQLLDSPAAQELLKHRVRLSQPTNFPDPSLSVNSWAYNMSQGRINALEAIRPLGALTRHIALSNGSNAGVLQESIQTNEGSTALMNILKFYVRLDHQIGDPTQGNLYDIEIKANAYSAVHPYVLRYSRQFIIAKSDPFEDEIDSELLLHVPIGIALDNAPGGTSNIGLAQIDTALFYLMADLHEEVDETEETSYEIPLKSFCFIPTVSVLGMSESTHPNTTSPAGGAGVQRWSASNDNSAESPFTGLPEFNQSHVSVNTRIADLLVSELESNPTSVLGSTLSSGEIYNFGKTVPANSNTTPTETTTVITQDLTIQNGGELWVNRDDLLGFMNNSTMNSRPQSFTVKVPDIDCDDTGQAAVVVANGGKIIIGDESISNIGHLYFGKNSSLEINGQEGVLVEKGSTLGIYGGAQATLEPNAKLELNKGGQCVISGGDGNAQSRLHIKAGSTLRLIKGSSIVVKNGGVLEIDAGSDLDLWWSESNIHIREGGELRINGDFNFDGKGFFQFDEGNVLSFGPNVNKFRLFGTEARDHRFIQVNEGAVLDFGDKDLNLRFGQINYKEGSKITMSGGHVDLFGVTFKGDNQGDNPNVGTFEIDNPDWIFADRCWFKGVESCMEISNFTGSGNSNTNSVRISYAEVTNSINGFMVRNSTKVKFDNCKFKGIASQALYAAKVILVEFLYCSIKEYANPANGIELANDVDLFRMRGGLIDGAQTGINVPCRNNDENISNVILEFGATIKNCTVAGIHLGKGGIIPDGSNENYGLVRMRCSKLLDNWVGISGVDILLDIDGCDLAGSSCMPNTFKRGLGLHHFNVKYVDRQDIIVRATNNYWSGDYPVGQVPGINYILKRANAMNSCLPIGSGSSLTLDFSDYLTSPPINCTNMVPTPGPKPTLDVAMFTGTIYECNIPIDGNKRVDEEYTDALWYLTNDQDAAALSRFQAVAGIPNSTRDAASATCQHDIDVSRVFAQALNPNSVNTNEENDFEENTSILALEAFPNPASESVRLVFGHPVFLVEVYDVLGKRYLSRKVENGKAISVRNWPPGLYWITAMDEETKERSTIKLVVK